MIPHFSNPHFLPKAFETVSRAELYHDDDADISHTYSESEVSRLNQLLAQTIEIIHYTPKSNSDDASERKKKRRKLEYAAKVEGDIKIELDEQPLFRLVSSTLPPLPVSLLPPPPPPPITREPEPEDTEIEAAVRRERAQIASIDGETILQQSKPIQSTSTFNFHLNLRTKLENPNPPIMIIRTTKLPRKTRPPVESSKLLMYPYKSDISTLAVEAIKPGKDFQTVDAETSQAEVSFTHRRSRRRHKANSQNRKHPVPQFWRPSSSLEGKCRGYAYGYPSYIAAATGSMREKYSRDRMKTGVHIDSV